MSTTPCSKFRAALTRGVASPIVRRQDGAVVDLADGQQDATWADGSAGERQLPQWRRNVLCERRYRRRETSPHAAPMVRDHTHLRSLGAGRITRWWKNMGNGLDNGPQTSAIVC